MGSIGFFIAFFGVIALLAIYPIDLSVTSFNETDSEATTSSDSQYEEDAPSQSSRGSSYTRTSSDTSLSQSPGLTERQIEERLAKLYRELDSLEESARRALLFEPKSPYHGKVRLSRGTVYRDDPDDEYVQIYAEKSNKTALNISDWYIESMVTERRAALPRGTRIPTSIRNHRLSDILLKPGERAYLVTGESPIDTSFHENQCTGYFEDRKKFIPSLRNECPDPIDEMEQFGNIKLDDDTCYEFVERLSRCTEVDDRDFDRSDDLSRSCERFLERELNYNSCVDNHENEPFFDDTGNWYIYLDRRKELWRDEREIIRLMDENARVIDVIEY